LLTSVPLSVHEFVAVGQFLVAAKAQNKNLWQVFWFGGTCIGSGNVDPDRRNYSFAQRYIASIRGVTVPLQLAVQLAIGVWLMARPDLIHSVGRSADVDHLIGAIIVTVAAISTAEVTRIARYVNVLVGGLLVVAALLFAREYPIVLISELLSGVAVAVAAIPLGEIVEKYAGWDKFVR
jgi:hypothetical protein